VRFFPAERRRGSVLRWPSTWVQNRFQKPVPRGPAFFGLDNVRTHCIFLASGSGYYPLVRQSVKI
jgi:hypothetical protein